MQGEKCVWVWGGVFGGGGGGLGGGGLVWGLGGGFLCAFRSL